MRRANDFGGSSKFGENRIALERDGRFFKRNFLRRAESGGSCRIGRKLSLSPAMRSMIGWIIFQPVLNWSDSSIAASSLSDLDFRFPE